MEKDNVINFEQFKRSKEKIIERKLSDAEYEKLLRIEALKEDFVYFVNEIMDIMDEMGLPAIVIDAKNNIVEGIPYIEEEDKDDDE